MRRVLCFAFAVAAAGSACTGSGGRRAAEDVGTPSPGRLVYAAIGASETAGVGTDDPIEDAWPRVLWETMPEGSVLYDFGVAGSTTRQALREQVPAASAVHPDVATVWLNVNDLLHGVAPSTFARDLSAVVEELGRGGQTTVLVANTPRLDSLPAYLACRSSSHTFVIASGIVECPEEQILPIVPPAAVRAAVAAYNRVIDRIVRREGAVLVDLHGLGNVPRAHPEYVSGDGFHPSSEGADVIAGIFERALRQSDG